jgi:hypothetical protein
MLLVFKLLSAIAPSSSLTPPKLRPLPNALRKESQPYHNQTLLPIIIPLLPTTNNKYCKQTQLELTGPQSEKQGYVGEEKKGGNTLYPLDRAPKAVWKTRRKVLPLPGLELRPFDRPARSQSLSWLRNKWK